jgi:hypothetical protein
MYYNFNNDLASGRKYEARAKKILEPDYGELEFCDDNRWDLKNDYVSFEVKTDFISKNTNLIGIEYKNRRNLTGISVTQADYYFIIGFDRSWSMIVDGIKCDGWWLGMAIETELLKDVCKLPFLKRVWGGDNKNTAMILVPVEQIREHTTDIYPMVHGVLT